MHCRTMGEKHPLRTVLFLSAIMHRKVKHVNFVFFSAILAGPRFVEIQKFCYHGNVTQRCHGIKICFYFCLRQLPSFSYQIINGPHFHAAATTAETLFMSEGHSVIDSELKIPYAPSNRNASPFYKRNEHFPLIN